MHIINYRFSKARNILQKVLQKFSQLHVYNFNYIAGVSTNNAMTFDEKKKAVMAATV